MDYLEFEQNLQMKMVPVRPDPGFVDRLNQRLRTQKNIIIEKSGGSISPALLVAGILLGVGLIFLIVGRYSRKK